MGNRGRRQTHESRELLDLLTVGRGVFCDGGKGNHNTGVSIPKEMTAGG